MLLRSLWLVAVLSLPSATRDGNQSGPVCGASGPTGMQGRDSAGVRIVESPPGGASASILMRLPAQPATTIGVSPSDSLYTFTVISAAGLLSSGEIVVADSVAVSVRVYSSTGRFVRQIGRRGQGPAEYQRVSFLKVVGDTIVIGDAPGGRINYFSPQGSLLRSVGPIGFVAFAGATARGGRATTGGERLNLTSIFVDGSFLAQQSVRRGLGGNIKTQVVEDTLSYLHVASSGASHDTIVRSVGARSFFFVSASGSVTFPTIPFRNIPSSAVVGNDLATTSGREFEIQIHSNAGKPVRIIRVCESAAQVDESHRRRAREEAISRATSDESRAQWQQVYAEMPFPETMPAFDRLVADPVGRLWARRFSAAADSARWHVFSLEGARLGDFLSPPNTELMYVDRTALLLRFTDAYDVQSLRVYRISSP